MGTLTAGIKEIFSSAKTTGSNVMLCGSDGTPDGHITMSNLALVLGANIYRGILNNVDLDTVTTAGCYKVQVAQNKPTDYWGQLNVVRLDETCYAQYFTTNTDNNELANAIFYRKKIGSGTWMAWQRIDNYGTSSLSELANALVKQNALSIGNVMVVTNVDSYTRFWPADRALESGIASIAVGAGIIENGRTLIIAKDAANKQWATSNVTGGTTAISDRRAAIADFDGRAKTTTILATLGDNAPAAKYCNEYYPSNVASSDSNMGAGRWWLPSLGEWAMIWAHVREVNFVLAAIGGTQIPVGSGWTWSSTEPSATNAWYLDFNHGNFGNYSKTTEYSVRPVSDFY